MGRVAVGDGDDVELGGELENPAHRGMEGAEPHTGGRFLMGGDEGVDSADAHERDVAKVDDDETVAIGDRVAQVVGEDGERGDVDFTGDTQTDPIGGVGAGHDQHGFATLVAVGAASVGAVVATACCETVGAVSAASHAVLGSG